MPHFPALNIRTDGISRLLTAYKVTLMNHNNYLTDGKNIIWKNMRKFMMYLSENEHDYLMIEYGKRRKMRPPRRREDEDPVMANLMNVPVRDRHCEEYINPREQGWRDRYYSKLFNISINKSRCNSICVNYLEGLEWTMNYYTTGCKDWRWEYKYDYPPLLRDLVKYVPYFDTEMLERKQADPVHELVQLSYVIPKPYLYLLPAALHKTLLETHPVWYSTDCVIVWAFCKYFWESHALLPHIPLGVLEEEIEQYLVGQV